MALLGAACAGAFGSTMTTDFQPIISDWRVSRLPGDLMLVLLAGGMWSVHCLGD